jgi:segregation and condensation protein B
LYGTTSAFLEKLGLDSLDDLPPLAAFIPGAEVVEALEVGLRVDPIEAVDVALDDDASDDSGGSDEPSDPG